MLGEQRPRGGQAPLIIFWEQEITIVFQKAWREILNSPANFEDDYWASTKVRNQRWFWWTCLQNSSADADLEVRLVDTAWEGEGGVNWESSVGTYNYYMWIREPVGLCCETQGAQAHALWQPRGVRGWGGRWEGGSGGRGHMCTCGWFVLGCGRNQHNTAKQLSSKKQFKKISKQDRWESCLSWNADCQPKQAVSLAFPGETPSLMSGGTTVTPSLRFFPILKLCDAPYFGCSSFLVSHCSTCSSTHL